VSWKKLLFYRTNHRIRRLPQARLVRGTSRAIVNADHFNVRDVVVSRGMVIAM
jgi:hypothetical protein